MKDRCDTSLESILLSFILLFGLISKQYDRRGVPVGLRLEGLSGASLIKEPLAGCILSDSYDTSLIDGRSFISALFIYTFLIVESHESFLN